MVSKACIRCTEIKELTDFHIAAQNRDGRSNTCRHCASEASKQRYLQLKVANMPPADIKLCLGCGEVKDKENFIAMVTNITDGLSTYCNLCTNVTRQIRKFGFSSAAEYWALMDEQKDSCAICEIEFSINVRPQVDHDHSCCPGKTSCGKCIRGFLCGACNVGLGSFKDDLNTIQRAAQYLGEKNQW